MSQSASEHAVHFVTPPLRSGRPYENPALPELPNLWSLDHPDTAPIPDEAACRALWTRYAMFSHIERHSECVAGMAEALARRIHAVVAVTGETDLVTDGTRAARCLGGCAEMGLVTGTGCMLSALTGALLAASPEQPFAAVCTAVCAMKTAGELARAALAPDEGSGSYRVRLIDAVNRLDGPTLAARAQWEEL